MHALDSFASGKVIADRYEIVSVLGRGGMGTVYEAIHLTLRKIVALKTLDLARGDIDPNLVGRFFLEAQAAAAIGHPNIVEVFDLGQDADVVYLAMERLDGEELADRVARLGRLTAADAARIGADLADAIAAAHERDIIHRDIKPQNVFLAVKGRHADIVKVLDFGIAKLAGGESANLSLTRTGEIFGTPLYMSPEQMKGARDIDARTDVYSMGVLLWEALAGTAPFLADTFPALAVKVLTEEPPPLRQLVPDVPDDLAAVIEQAMRKEPRERLATAREMSDRLGEIARRLGATAGGGSVYSSSPPAPSPSRFHTTDYPREIDRATMSGFVTSVRRPAVAPTGPRPWLYAALATASAALIVGALGAGYRSLRTRPGTDAPAPARQIATVVHAAAVAPVVDLPFAPDASIASPPVPIAPRPDGTDVTASGAPHRINRRATQPLASPLRIAPVRANRATESAGPPPLLDR